MSVTDFFDFPNEIELIEYTPEQLDALEQKEESTPHVWEERQPLFKKTHNPNKEIFIVPTQSGADKDDQGHGSIGDATMQHVSRMSHRLPEIEHFFHVSNGALFRFEENVRWSDGPTSSVSKTQMMQVITDPRLTNEEKDALEFFFMEEIKEDQRRFDEKNDALDHPCVPYEDWERFPQMHREWDVPATPKPNSIYAGDTKQMFYDFFPEDHPDAPNINAFISSVNSVDWDHFSDYTADWYRNWLEERQWAIPTAPMHLSKFLDVVSSEQMEIAPDELMITALQAIEDDFRQLSNKRAMDAFMSSVPTQLLAHFYHKNKDRFERGELIWRNIGKVGKQFYKISETNSAHWAKYMQMKAFFAPRIIMSGVDLNRGNLNKLTKVLGDKEKAKALFFARPFMSFEDIVAKKLCSLEDIKGTKKNAAFINVIKKAAQTSDTLPLRRLAQQIVEYQKENEDKMSSEEWATVWQVYRIAKKKVENSI